MLRAVNAWNGEETLAAPTAEAGAFFALGPSLI
jgi:hypothetical protein